MVNQRGGVGQVFGAAFIGVGVVVVRRGAHVFEERSQVALETHFLLDGFHLGANARYLGQAQFVDFLRAAVHRGRVVGHGGVVLGAVGQVPHAVVVVGNLLQASKFGNQRLVAAAKRAGEGVGGVVHQDLGFFLVQFQRFNLGAEIGQQNGILGGFLERRAGEHVGGGRQRARVNHHWRYYANGLAVA